MQFSNNSCGFQHVFQHRLHPDTIEHADEQLYPIINTFKYSHENFYPYADTVENAN